MARALAIGLAALAAITALTAWPASADLTVRMPDIDFRTISVEHDGLIPLGRKGAALTGLRDYTQSVGYGVLPSWGIELEGDFQSGSNQRLNWDATLLESTVRILDAKDFPLGLAIYTEYAHARRHEEAGSITFGPIIEEKLHHVLGMDSVHTLNLLLARDVGRGIERAIAFQYAWQTLLPMWPAASPAIELYGFVPDLAHSGHFRQQEHLGGPVLVGHMKLPYGQLGYAGGYLFGLTPASSRGAVRWRLTYEFAF